jgi:hypothetical protein
MTLHDQLAQVCVAPKHNEFIAHVLRQLTAR